MRDKIDEEVFSEDELEEPVFKGVVRYLISETYAKPHYAVKRYLMVLLWALHNLIKERDFYSMSDYLYWPDGLCWDMVVLIVLGIVMFLCGWDDFKVWRKLFSFPSWEEIKDGLGLK